MKVKLVVLDQQIDTSTSTGMLLFTMLGAIATFENDLRRDRQSQGVEHAIRRGVKFGRKCVLTDEQLMSMKSRRLSGDSIQNLMNQFKVSRATVYRCLSQDGV
jgi:DNA invertase Pin-like site-specific DNA recombinase